jgi:hypothetical protein
LRWFSERARRPSGRFAAVQAGSRLGLIVYYSLIHTEYMPRPYPNYKMARKVKYLKDTKKLSYRQMAKLLEKDVKQVWRWYHYPLPPSQDQKVLTG